MNNALHFRAHLASIVAAWPTMLAPKSSSGGIGGGNNPSRPPADLDALSLRQEVTAWLASLCLLVIEERELATRNLDGTDAVAMCGWLDAHAEWVVEHEAGEAFAEELSGWAREVHRLVAPAEPKPDVVVASPAAESGDLVRDRFSEALLRCTVTGQTGTALDWYRARFPELNQDVTIAELAQMEGVSEVRIRDRLRNAKMAPTLPHHRPVMYDLAEWEWRKAMRRSA